MTKSIAGARLISQQISKNQFKSAGEVVSWMGAMQAQDFNMANWAIGLRMKKGTKEQVTRAINSGEILRTHILRPTWHFVPRNNIYWMLELTAPKIKAAMKSMNKKLELTPEVFKKCNSLIEKNLRDKNYLTRKELVKILSNNRIAIQDQRASNIFLNAELEGIICSGKMKGKETTYALLKEIIPEKEKFNKEKALFDLASQYFKSRSPATLSDFFWWSGLSAKYGKDSLELLKNNFIKEKIEGKEYILPVAFNFPRSPKENLFLLPAFDEFLISYKERSELLSKQFQSNVFTNNGIFRPLIVENGKVIGIWKKEAQLNKIVIHTHFFDPINFKKYSLLEEEMHKFKNFLGTNVEISVARLK